MELSIQLITTDTLKYEKIPLYIIHHSVRTIHSIYSFIAFYMPNNNFIFLLLGFTFGLSIIPLSIISFLLIKRLRKEYTIKTIALTTLKVFAITLSISITITDLTFNNPYDIDFQYQESVGYDFTALLLGLAYMLIIIVYIFNELPPIKEKKHCELDVVKIIYDVVFYFSIFLLSFFILTIYDYGLGSFVCSKYLLIKW